VGSKEVYAHPETDGRLGGVDCRRRQAIFADSGELLQRESAKLAWCGPPLDVLLLSDDNQGLALLLDYFLSSGMVAIISHDMNSGGVL
jgi:hypothetical protein